MKYVIYAAVGLLILWSVWYVVRNIVRQVRGRCASGCGGCDSCGTCGGAAKKHE